MQAQDLYDYIFKSIIFIIQDKKESDGICKLIFTKVFNFSEIDIFLNKNIKNFDKDKIDNIISRIKKKEPIQYILGVCDFLDCELFVNENVLIPRQETQEMVYRICHENNFKNKNVLDLCCGSGCIAIAVKKYFPQANVVAVDISEKALEVAKKNAFKNNVEINFYRCDIFSKNILKTNNIDVIISNPPYVCEKEKENMGENILKYEPESALFVKNDNPLIFYKRILEILPKILNSHGAVFCEINEAFANEVMSLFHNITFKEVKINKDINDKNRWISAIGYE